MYIIFILDDVITIANKIKLLLQYFCILYYPTYKKLFDYCILYNVYNKYQLTVYNITYLYIKKNIWHNFFIFAKYILLLSYIYYIYKVFILYGFDNNHLSQGRVKIYLNLKMRLNMVRCCLI